MKLMKRLSRFALALVPLLITMSARADVIVYPRYPRPTEPPKSVSEVTSAFNPSILLPLLLIAALLVATALLVRRFSRKS